MYTRHKTKVSAAIHASATENRALFSSGSSAKSAVNSSPSFRVFRAVRGKKPPPLFHLQIPQKRHVVPPVPHNFSKIEAPSTSAYSACSAVHPRLALFRAKTPDFSFFSDNFLEDFHSPSPPKPWRRRMPSVFKKPRPNTPKTPAISTFQRKTLGHFKDFNATAQKAPPFPQNAA